MASLLDDIDVIAAMLDAAGAPLPPEFMAALKAGQLRLDEATARVPAVMAEISAGLNGAPPRPTPLRIRGRKRAKTA